MNERTERSESNRATPALGETAVLEMLPAYVLGALEVDEMLAVDDYLAAHPRLLTRVAELEAAADQLALAAPEVEPPPTAKAGLMARVQVDAGVQSILAAMSTPPAPVPAPRAAPPSLPPLPPAARSLARQKDSPGNWIDRLRDFLGGNFFWPSLATGALAALLVVAVYTGQTERQARHNATELAAAQARIAALESQADELRQINQQLEKQLSNDRNQLALFANADRVVALAGTPDAPNASGTFYSSGNSGLIVLRNLPPLPAEQTYELWLIPGEGSPIPAGLLQVGDGESHTFPIALAGHPTDFAAVGLSIEPAGGSPAPTGPIVLLGKAG